MKNKTLLPLAGFFIILTILNIFSFKNIWDDACLQKTEGWSGLLYSVSMGITMFLVIAFLFIHEYTNSMSWKEVAGKIVFGVIISLVISSMLIPLLFNLSALEFFLFWILLIIAFTLIISYTTLLALFIVTNFIASVWRFIRCGCA
jgi:hypothetical protein